MPWPKKQAMAILIKAQRSGDTALAAKARRSLRGGSSGSRKAQRKRR